jgi:hypothetical protein
VPRAVACPAAACRAAIKRREIITTKDAKSTKERWVFAPRNSKDKKHFFVCFVVKVASFGVETLGFIEPPA